MKQIVLRRASAEDIGWIFDLLKSVDLPVDDLASALPFMYVGYYDESKVGIGGVEVVGEYGLLRSVATVPELRGRGFGIPFCRALVQMTREKKLSSLYLLTTSAENFFTKLGFVKVERSEAPKEIAATTEFSSLCPDSAVCMRLILQ